MSNNTSQTENNEQVITALKDLIRLDSGGVKFWREYHKTLFEAFLRSDLANDHEVRTSFMAAHEENMQFFTKLKI
ncbi:hypothetical protein [Leeuwenhoekiella sp. MAR_2009_132]|uniref:hypothetical protein n=1 Tax=Leeuwenhoekiella sp. MAR_2009_132 TaxID=1392489 RepID=UPI000491D975|nr:hypothetical protein [Leeuwenhoekiella sp. MAR_2009_132]